MPAKARLSPAPPAFCSMPEVEAGTLCPITMTFAATPLLQHALPAPFRDWLSPLLSDRYDPHLAPGGQKRGLLIGMGMTEKQGGSDVLSNTTRAEKTAEGFYRLVGHKWFFSVPQSDAHWCWLRLRRGSHASLCRVCCPTGSVTACVLNA